MSTENTPKVSAVTLRQRRLAEKRQKAGAKHFSCWLSAEEDGRLSELVRKGYGATRQEAVARAIQDALARLE